MDKKEQYITDVVSWKGGYTPSIVQERAYKQGWHQGWDRREEQALGCTIEEATAWQKWWEKLEVKAGLELNFYKGANKDHVRQIFIEALREVKDASL